MSSSNFTVSLTGEPPKMVVESEKQDAPDPNVSLPGVPLKFNLQEPNQDVVVTVTPPYLNKGHIVEFEAFANWLMKLNGAIKRQHDEENHPFHEDPYALKSIQIQAADIFGIKKSNPDPDAIEPEELGKYPGGVKGGRVGFLKLQAEVKNEGLAAKAKALKNKEKKDKDLKDEEKEREDEKTDWLSGAVFMRGACVAMMIIFRVHVQEGGQERIEEWVPLTQQPRIPAGSLDLLELPAGMIDKSKDFGGAAGREIAEELHLLIPTPRMTNMSRVVSDISGADEAIITPGTFPSAGGSDEFIQYFLYRQDISAARLAEMQGKETGIADERIKIQLVRLKDLWWKAGRDAKALAALALYENIRKNCPERIGPVISEAEADDYTKEKKEEIEKKKKKDKEEAATAKKEEEEEEEEEEEATAKKVEGSREAVEKEE